MVRARTANSSAIARRGQSSSEEGTQASQAKQPGGTRAQGFDCVLTRAFFSLVIPTFALVPVLVLVAR